MKRKPFDLEAAKKWANYGDSSKPIIASKKTTERHDSEFKFENVFSLNDPEAIKRTKKMRENFNEKYRNKD